MLEIREARRAEIPSLATLVAAAFGPLPLWQWLIPDHRVRPRLLAASVRRELDDVHARDGMLLVTEVDGTVLAVAVWAAPGQQATPWWRSVLAAPRLMRAGTRGSLQTLGRRGPLLDKELRAAHPQAPHWYLGLLAVDPAAQSGGLGGRLVRAGLARADTDCLPAYLECEEHLLPYYARFGFTLTHTVQPVPEAPAHHGMWRAPQGAGAPG